MTDASDEQSAERVATASSPSDPAGDDESIEALRAEVEEKYDFDNFRPADMAEMTAAEWEAAFDPDTWITGRDLLDRVEKDLRNQIASREVFAVLERRSDPPSVVAYSDEGWAVVYGDGSVEGEGTVLRDVKPTVALCSMDSYEVREPPEEYELPTPEEVKSGTGEFGNLMIQTVAGMQILGGLVLGAVWLVSVLSRGPVTWVPLLPDFSVTTIAAPVAALFFLFIGVFLFAVVANARLSDRFRAEEYRDRLRAAGITEGGDAEFVPFEEVAEEALAAARGEEPSRRDTSVPPSEGSGAVGPPDRGDGRDETGG
ncbi:hypothetical protein Hbl1158_05695 [Halobaculum sp. CBA1158]|uniref:DUF7319 domain-containing protein n=1 Tax=Halobaculum sp. CBA1158 TaxID=2904243 RepID=UPI001F1931C1|nr:hypothetical protein [Halobaculum sp. CBA1158]UIP00849.1 hypothetical protein Hbl1158_05695 [Halobaculum sp. CBA1158]